MATTGRKRRCGWLDMNEVKQACLENGVDHIVLTKTDVFAHLSEQKIYVSNKIENVSNIKSPSLEDKSFVSFLDIVKTEAEVNKISFTTGPNRGEIIWQ